MRVLFESIVFIAVHSRAIQLAVVRLADNSSVVLPDVCRYRTVGRSVATLIAVGIHVSADAVPRSASGFGLAIAAQV